MVPLGSVRRLKVLILRSRAVVACEPGQVREEAALSDTDHAPWGSRRGAVRRRERLEPIHNGGCTVQLPKVDVPQRASRLSGHADGTAAFGRPISDLFRAG